jgi:heme-degrading monooxygenase HmoA
MPFVVINKAGKAPHRKSPKETFMADANNSRWGYMIVWEFRPRKGMETRFEEAYGPQGIWVKLFSTGRGFIGTELNRDLNDPSRYFTLDLWISKEAFETFRSTHQQEYKAIDQQCEALTAEEKPLGEFQRL